MESRHSDLLEEGILNDFGKDWNFKVRNQSRMYKYKIFQIKIS